MSVRLLVAAVLATLALASPAHALPDCSPLPEKRTLLTGQGQLESIISDARGRIFYSDIQNGGRLFRLDAPGAEPKQLVQGINGTGGLAWDTDGSLVLGFNGGNQNAVADGTAGGLLHVNPETGETAPLASGMGMANGIVRGPDGAFYASNDFAGGIDRVKDGKVEDDWSKVQTPNGLVIDTAGRYLYAAQTFKPASVARIDLSNPAKEEPYYEATAPDLQGGPDGMTRDDRDRLFVAVNASGEVWRIDTDRTACRLASGIMNASAVNWGGGAPGFPARNLYVVGFSGVLVELADATDRPPPAGPPAAKPPRLRLAVEPKRVAAGSSTRWRFAVTAGGRAMPGATVRFAGRRATTNADGRAELTVRIARAGLRKASAALAGYPSARKTVRLLPRR
ncbi:MAG TPA: SMP-30/gluconolactonase/LRE family protein [Thermoleophilaceae bacterium]